MGERCQRRPAADKSFDELLDQKEPSNQERHFACRKTGSVSKRLQLPQDKSNRSGNRKGGHDGPLQAKVAVIGGLGCGHPHGGGHNRSQQVRHLVGDKRSERGNDLLYQGPVDDKRLV